MGHPGPAGTVDFEAQLSAGPPAVLHLRGDLDFATARDFQRQIDKAMVATDDELRIDLAEVTFLDSAGLRTLMVAWRRLMGLERSFKIVNPSKVVRQILEISGLDQVLTVEPAA